MATLSGHPARHFADETAWKPRLDAMSISGLKVHPDPVTVVLGLRRAAGPQARHLHRNGAFRQGQGPLPDLVVLRRPQGRSSRTNSTSQSRTEGPI
jgi:hypothetical protein